MANHFRKSAKATFPLSQHGQQSLLQTAPALKKYVGNFCDHSTRAVCDEVLGLSGEYWGKALVL